MSKFTVWVLQKIEVEASCKTAAQRFAEANPAQLDRTSWENPQQRRDIRATDEIYVLNVAEQELD